MELEYKTVDEQYADLINSVSKNGELVVCEEGSKLILLNVQMKFNNINLPILTTREINHSEAIESLLSIWKEMNSDSELLQQGLSYGTQLRSKTQPIVVDEIFLTMFFNGELSIKPTKEDYDRGYDSMLEVFEKDEYEIYLNQVDFILYSTKKHSTPNRIKAHLWSIEDLCIIPTSLHLYETSWQTLCGKLNLTVNVDSLNIIDIPYNIYQYAILHRLIAQVSGYEVGELCFNIDNAHIYDRHLELAEKQIQGEVHEPPTVWINPDVKSFYDFTVDDIKVENYKHNGNFSYEIAI